MCQELAISPYGCVCVCVELNVKVLSSEVLVWTMWRLSRALHTGGPPVP